MAKRVLQVPVGVIRVLQVHAWVNGVLQVHVEGKRALLHCQQGFVLAKPVHYCCREQVLDAAKRATLDRRVLVTVAVLVHSHAAELIREAVWELPRLGLAP